MIEPISGVVLSDEVASMRRHRRPEGTPSRRVVIILEAYENLNCQKAIALIVRELFDAGQITLICLEADQGSVDRFHALGNQITPLLLAPDPFSAISRAVSVSAGVVLLACADTAGALRLAGVDSSELVAAQHRIRVEARAQRAHRMSVLEQLIETVRAQRDRCFPEPLCRTSDFLHSFYGRSSDLKSQMPKLCEYARKLSVDLEYYPAIRDAVEFEGHDKHRVDRERTRLAERFAEKLGRCCRLPRLKHIDALLRSGQVTLGKEELDALGVSESEVEKYLRDRQSEESLAFFSALFTRWIWQANIGPDWREPSFDVEELLPIIRLWSNTEAIDQSKIPGTLARSGAGDFVVNVLTWVIRLLARNALEAIFGRKSVFEAARNVVLVAMALEMDLSDFEYLRRMLGYAARVHRRAADETLAEATSLARTILRKYSTDPMEKGILAIEDSLGLLHAIIEPECAAPGALSRVAPETNVYADIVGQLSQFADVSPLLCHSGDFAAAQDCALQFQHLSQLRSEGIIAGTIRAMDRLGERAAMLVCGGFHLEMILNELEQRELLDVEYSVVQSSLSLSKGGVR